MSTSKIVGITVLIAFTMGIALVGDVVAGEREMEKFNGYLFAKLDRIGSKSEGPEYFLQQWDNQGKARDTPIQKKAELWKIDPKLHKFLGQKVTILGTIKEKLIQYEEIKKY